MAGTRGGCAGFLPGLGSKVDIALGRWLVIDVGVTHGQGDRRVTDDHSQGSKFARPLKEG